MIKKDHSFCRLKETGNKLDERCLAATAPPHKGDHLPRRQIERDAAQNTGRLRPTIPKTHVPQFDPAFKTMHRGQSGTIIPLLWLLLENIVEPVNQNCCQLQVVPNTESAQNRRVRNRRQRTEGDKSADAEMTVDHLVCANPEKNCGRN